MNAYLLIARDSLEEMRDALNEERWFLIEMNKWIRNVLEEEIVRRADANEDRHSDSSGRFLRLVVMNPYEDDET